MISVTTHTIVKNEDLWIWYALIAVKDLVKEMLVVDDNSVDNTAAVIRSIKSPNIKFSQTKLTTPDDLTAMRNKMIEDTKTDWFIILDGDEVWKAETFIKFLNFLEKQPQHIYAVMMRTNNCIGDVFHYLPESSGRYSVLGIKGNLNIRAYRKLPGFTFRGAYPLEAYCDSDGKSINEQDEHLSFFDDSYWHMTFLKRSSSVERVKGWRSKKLELGFQVKTEDELPEVFFIPRPEFVPSALKHMNLNELVAAAAITPLKHIKRAIIK